MIATSTTAKQRASLFTEWTASGLTIQKLADRHGITFIEMAYLLNAAIKENTTN